MRTSWLIANTLLAMSMLLVGCRSREEQRLRELVDLEAPGGGPVSSQRVEELRRDIRRFRAVVDEKVEAAGRVASFHKLLALEYIKQRMYGLALESLRSAIEIEPGNNVLLYLAAVAAGNIAKSSAEPDPVPGEYLQLAERYYLEALEIDGNYISACYGLAILYLFELERPEDARAHIDRLVAENDREPNYIALQGRMYAALGDTVRAAELYGQVARYSRDTQMRRDALRNQTLLLEAGQQ